MDPTRINVLLIEDNPDDHFFIERMLNHASGYLYRFEVAHAERLSTGLAYLSQNRVDLILLDLSLPDVHGLETFVITYGQADDVPIVVLSGHDDETLAARAVALGAQDYLVKGRVKHDLLARSIIYAIERKQAEAESRASERRRAGEALQASEARYRNIIEKNADGILIVDVEGVIRFINPAAETLFGCQAEELVNTSFDFPLAVGEKTEITIARRNNSGETVIAEMHLAETEWEGKTTYLASLRDVTERVQAQKALHYRVDFQKLIADISARFVQLEHYHLEDHIGQTLQMIGEFAGVDRSFILIVSNEDAALRHAYEWCAAGIPTRFNEKRNLNLSNYTWMAESLKRFGNIRVPRVTDLPPEAEAERKYLHAYNIQSCMIVPVIYSSYLTGVIGFEQINSEETWSEDTFLLLKLVGEIIVNTLERKRVEVALRDSELHYRAVVEDQTELICRFRSDGTLTFVNQAYCRYFRQDRKTILNQNFFRPMRSEDQARVIRSMTALHWGDPVINLKHPYINSDKQECWLQWSIRALPDEQGNTAHFQAVGHDITAQTQVETTLTKLSRVVEQTADNVIITDHAGLIEYVNPAFEVHTGYTSPEVLGKTPHILKSGKHEDQFYLSLWEDILSGQVYSGTIINKKKSGELYYEAVTITPIKDAEGHITHFVSTGKDITERKRAEEILRHEATHDALTGLPNRSLFKRRLDQALAQANREPDCHFAVLFLDLDRLKVINDTLGHMVGDHLLIAVARRLEAAMRVGDTVARMGGDEFTVLVDHISDVDDVIQVANRIQEELSIPINLYGQEVFTTASIGIAMSHNGYTQAEAILRDADTAMYRAKTLGKARYELFDLALQSPTVGHLQLNTDLRYAVERQGFQLHYQPIVSLQSGQITGMEALVRWPHPERGFISPAEFIPLAEETGLIVPIGEWVLQTACRQNKIWQDMGYNQLRVAVNISARQIQGRNLLELVQEVLADTELAPENLEIEITESLEMMRNLDLNTSTLNSLSDLGVKISIDDFGNRYSSLVYLKLFPINNIKIDKSFVDDMAYVADSAAITAGIITMAHNLRLKVIAEGVETQEQLSCLRTQQCDEIQGYLFSQPVSASDATQLLRQSASLQSNVKSRKQMCP